jgi:hypothetical protein
VSTYSLPTPACKACAIGPPAATKRSTCYGVGCSGIALRRRGLRKDSVPRRLQLVGEPKLQVQQVQCLVLRAGDHERLSTVNNWN